MMTITGKPIFVQHQQPVWYVEVETLTNLDVVIQAPESAVELMIISSRNTGEPKVYNRLLNVFRCTNVYKIDLKMNVFNDLAVEFGYSGADITELLGIINHHLMGDRDMLICQDELIDAGFAGVARL